MTISYNWVSEYLPERLSPEALSVILTSIGLEVESLEPYETVKGGLQGLVIGEVLTCEPHPNADKLKITTVNTGAAAPLQIVCGAANVAARQKVVVATVGTTIYPTGHDAITMKVAKIRGIESYGMICAEDEIGLGTSHEGILVLDANAVVGTPAAEYFKTYNDFIYEIGLTPNRMDAMSHLGVAKDVCAYLSHHQGKAVQPLSPFTKTLVANDNHLPIIVTIENTDACQRYAGVSITGVTVKPSPEWLQNKLKAIGLRPINNIVDVTNFILHETGQPLHAFDANAIKGNKVIVKNLPEGTPFITLDDKERKLHESDLMICNESEGMCIAGVFGGAESGVKDSTTNIFLESAWFSPVSIRRTSVGHGLRTDAATRFEKGVDISNTVKVLERAALLIQEVGGGNISSDVIDVYPAQKAKAEVTITYNYLKKLSGKTYLPEQVKTILIALGFEVLQANETALTIAVPYSKPDISLPADIVEEILRIDGLDNIAIPATISLSPAIETLGFKDALKDKLSNFLVGMGFNEILTNSITNGKYFIEETLQGTVKMMNSLSADLDVLRPSMLETGLETIVYNLNRKNNNLRFFELGKTYATNGVGKYYEEEHLSLYITGANHEDEWTEKARQQSIYTLKGYAAALLSAAGFTDIIFAKKEETAVLDIYAGKQLLGNVSQVAAAKLKTFDLKQPVFYCDLSFTKLLNIIAQQKITYTEITKFPAVQRDLALVLDKTVTFKEIEDTVKKQRLNKLSGLRLFDVFESEKLGAGKKSMGISFTFTDDEKTLTDAEIEGMTGKLIKAFEKELAAEIRS